MGPILNSKIFTKGTKIETMPGETILFETGANHFKGIEGLGGRLYLTDKRLLFKSHKFNIQNHELSISLTDIDKIESYKLLGLTNNALSVKSGKSKYDKFAIENPEECIEIINNLNGLQQAGLHKRV